MSVAGTPKWSWRLEEAEISRLVWAFAISLALHVAVVGTYYGGKQLGWWDKVHWPAWMQNVRLLTEVFKPKAPQPPPQPPREAPLMFVDVNPAQAAAEPPKDAQYYSAHNSVAANPEPVKDLATPKITGEQTHVAKTEDAPRKQFTPLQPTPQIPVAQEEQPELKAKPAQPPGDLAMAKPEPAPKPAPKTDPGEDTRSRPRTLKEAMARQLDRHIPGQKMKQDGGVRRQSFTSSLSAKATPTGSYDAALIEAISSRWYTLLDQRDYASDSRGKVVLHFVLHFDGRVSEMTVEENTAGEVLGLICQKAVLDPSPYAAWPADMRRLLGETRNIQFTFYYN